MWKYNVTVVIESRVFVCSDGGNGRSWWKQKELCQIWRKGEQMQVAVVVTSQVVYELHTSASEIFGCNPEKWTVWKKLFISYISMSRMETENDKERQMFVCTSWAKRLRKYRYNLRAMLCLHIRLTLKTFYSTMKRHLWNTY